VLFCFTDEPLHLLSENKRERIITSRKVKKCTC